MDTGETDGDNDYDMGNGEEMWMQGKLTVIAIMTLKIVGVSFSLRR